MVGIHIEPKCDSAICVELSDALFSLATSKATDDLHARIPSRYQSTNTHAHG